MTGMNAYVVVLGLATAAVSGLVGAFALMKRMTLAGDVVSHLALPGLGLAYLWHVHPIIGAAATLGIGIVVIHQLQRGSNLATETAIGVVFVAALALGALLTPEQDLVDALFGGFSPVTLPGFGLGFLGCLAVVLSIARLRHELILIVFSPDLAKSIGIRVDRVNFVYFCTFGLTILLGLQFLGALLVGALIIVPAAAGRQLAGTLAGFLAASAACGVASVGVGFAIAAHWHLSLGPTIVGVSCALFGVGRIVKGSKLSS
jgi:ABC-type Mn2+/Zn2+ transport system permease subunit